MGAIDDAIRKHDVLSSDGLENALRDIEKVPEGEVRFITSFDLGGQSVEFRKKRVLADAFLERKIAKEERKKNQSNAFFAIVGVIVGAAIPKVFDLIFCI